MNFYFYVVKGKSYNHDHVYTLSHVFTERDSAVKWRDELRRKMPRHHIFVEKITETR